jgi:hypothetical protein
MKLVKENEGISSISSQAWHSNILQDDFEKKNVITETGSGD